MEIVVNKCFGGFGLSKKALTLLSEKGYKTFKSWKELENKSEDQIWILFDRNDFYSNFDEHRTNKDLIEVVKKLGKESNGMCANLEIIEIPDGIEYFIDDYDGMETVREQHRSW